MKQIPPNSNPPKKPKNFDVADPQPATSQDSVSTTFLKRETLRALNRENKQAAREFRLSQRLPCAIVVPAQEEWKRYHRLIEPSERYLESCELEQRKALQSFAKSGGPDLRDIRGCQRAAVHVNKGIELSPPSRTLQSHQASITKVSTDAGTNKSLSPYNRPFEQLLIDSHIYHPYYIHPDGTAAPKPKNLRNINKRLARRRPSLSSSKFTKADYDAFIQNDISAINEEDVKRNVIPSIQGTTKDPKTASAEVLFVNLTPFTTDEKVASGKPDFYRGARPEQLKRSVRKELSHLIVPSTQENIAILPNQFTAVKGPDGHSAVARRQAMYDSYLGARGMHALQNYGQAEPFFDNKAYTFAFIYLSPTLSGFVSHPVKSDDPGKPPCYYLTAVCSFSMLQNIATWREGATYYRNAIELAKEWRDEFIRAANNVNQAPIAWVAPNASTSFASIGNQLDAPTMGSQGDSGGNEDFEAAEMSQGEEEAEEREVGPAVAEQSSRRRRQARSRKQRQNREESADVVGILSSRRYGASQPSSSAKRRGGRGRRGKKVA